MELCIIHQQIQMQLQMKLHKIYLVYEKFSTFVSFKKCSKHKITVCVHQKF